jgi:hypothetical protein
LDELNEAFLWPYFSFSIAAMALGSELSNGLLGGVRFRAAGGAGRGGVLMLRLALISLPMVDGEEMVEAEEEAFEDVLEADLDKLFGGWLMCL